MLAEYGLVVSRGLSHLRKSLPFILEDADNGLSAPTRLLFNELLDELLQLDKRISVCEKRITLCNKSHAPCQRLEEILGIGSITANALYAEIGDAKAFKNGRHLSAWLGVVPRQHSSGGKDMLMGISKRGNAYLRTLLIHGARAVLRHIDKKTDRLSLWAKALVERRGHNKACVAVANKLARMAWVILAKGERYRLAR